MSVFERLLLKETAGILPDDPDLHSLKAEERLRRAFAKEIWTACKEHPLPVPDPNRAWKQALSMFPPQVEAAWTDKGMSARSMGGWEFAKEAMRVHEDLGSRFPMAASAGTVGIFSPGERQVKYYAKTKPGILDYPYSWKGIVDVCGHEIGHFVDWVSLTPSNGDAFSRLFESEGSMMEEYSRQDPQEYFADACWLYVRFPDIARKWLPKTMAWFDVFFRDLNDTL